MLYVLVVGALVSLGALAMERAMRACALPQRWVWAAAMVLGLVIPAAARWMPRAPLPAPSPPASAPASVAPAAEATRIRLAELSAPAVETLPGLDLAALDGPLAAGWMASSALALLALLVAAAMLEQRRWTWRPAKVHGVPVLLSAGTGPAVVGLFRSRIVLPAWVMDADPAERALLLEHEREHLRAGDPRLLALGLAVIVLAPWNPAAWYGLRRLRLAIEIDCDARVLARRADVRAYGSLLLEVGRRASSGGRWITAAAFSEPASFLERRIRIMTSPRARFPWLRAGVFGAAALALVMVACQAPGPVEPASAAAGARRELVRTETASTEELLSLLGSGVHREAIIAAVRAHYPEVLRAVATDTAHLLFVQSSDGEILRHARTERGLDVGPEPEAGARLRAEARLTEAEGEVSVTDFVRFGPGELGPGRVEVAWMRHVPAGDAVVITEVDTITAPQPRVRVAQQPEISLEQAREYVERYMPDVARSGTTAESVWFLADADGQVVQYGEDGFDEIWDANRANLPTVLIFPGQSLVINGHEIPVAYARLAS